MTEKLVYMKIKDHIATIYINRPEKRNALTAEMWKGIAELVDECNADPDVKVMIFRSVTTEVFSAGADISEFTRFADSPNTSEEFNRLPMMLEEKITCSLKPSIAMIQGYCIGGGCEIAIACDFRFSDSTGKFAITPAKLGLIFNTPGTKNLIDLIGPANAKDMLYSGRIIDADEAKRMGLINGIIESDKLEKETYDYARMISQNAQLSIRGSKKIINEILNGASSNSEEVDRLVQEAYLSDDFQEGVEAFLNKRKPRFSYS